MLFAIVDIETTGGYASAGGITEVAITIHDGNEVVDTYQTLINPMQPIPRFIEALTGITNEMVADAPVFPEVAPLIYQHLRDKVFVAHNVNFDYSFLKYFLAKEGFELNSRKLCTVRLGRKLFPGLKSYSLGNFCRALNIPVYHRHRAGGDVAATVQLFEKMITLPEGIPTINEFLKLSSGQQSLPMFLDAEQIKNLPRTPGVYYFSDQKGNIIYVGKAKDLRKRVSSHFTNNRPGRQKQDFIRKIHRVSYISLATEFMALLLESAEIKRLWPAYNRSQKNPVQEFALYSFEDLNGYQRLAIEKKRKNLKSIYNFGLLLEGRNMLEKLVRQFDLCARLCFLQTEPCSCGSGDSEGCHSAPEEYNKRVQQAVKWLQQELPSYLLVDQVDQQFNHFQKWSVPDPKKKSQGLFSATSDVPRPARMKKTQAGAMVKSCVLIEKGTIYGMGYVPGDLDCRNIQHIKPYLTRLPDNDYLRGLISRFAVENPEKVIAV
ncbi:MAG TPA: exonuclease domain-containing protein [Parasegetibacter sp.]